jgi:hypothetical protein
MQLREFVQTVRKDPAAFIEPVDPKYLSALLSGYKAVNGALRAPLQKLAERYADRYSGVDICWIAYLHFPPPQRGVDWVLQELDVLLEKEEVPFEEGPWARERCMDPILDAIKQGRPGMMLGEPSVFWLASYTRGFMTALCSCDPGRAKAEQAELDGFEAWLQEELAEPGVPWHRLIRAFDGGCQEGVGRFAWRWDKWQELRRRG